MKFRKTVSSVVVSALLAIVVLLAVLHFHASTYGLDRVRQIVQSVIPQGDHGLAITMDSVDSTLMKGIRVNGIRMTCDDGTDAVSIGSAEMSLNLLGLLGAALGIGSPDANIVVSDVCVLVNDVTVQKIKSVVSDMGKDKEEAKEKGKVPFEKVKLSLRVTNLSFDVDYNDIRAKSDGINAAMEMGRGFDFHSADLNIPSVVASFGVSDDINVDDIRASVDENLVAYLSFSETSYGDLLSLTDASAIAKIGDGLVSAALYLDKMSARADDLEANVSGSTVNAEYNLDSGGVTFKASFVDLKASEKSASDSVSVENLVVSGSFDGKDGISAKILSGKADASVSGYALDSRSLVGDISFGISNLSSLGQITMTELDVKGLKDFGVSSFKVPTITLDYSYSSAAIGARVRSSVSIKHDNPIIGNLSLELNASAQLGQNLAISSADVQISDIKMAALRDSAKLSLSLDGSGVAKGEFNSSTDLSMKFGYEAGKIDFNMFLSSLKPSEYKGLYENILKDTAVVSQATVLDGNVVASVGFSDEFSEFLTSAISGRFEALESGLGALDIIRSGRLSVNTAVSDLKMGESSRSGAVTLEAVLDNGLATIGSLAITTGNVRLSYEGTLEVAELIPDGRLALQRSSDGSELASIVFNHSKGLKTYEFTLKSPLVEGSSISGTVDWQNLNRILANVDVNASLFGSKPLSFNAVASVNPVKISLSGDNLLLDATMADNMIKADGFVKDLTLHLTNVLSINLNSSVSGVFNTGTSEYTLSLLDFSSRFSNGLGLGFDLDFSNSGLRINRLSVLEADVIHALEGSFDFTFSDLGAILRGDTSTLDGYMDYTSQSGFSHLHGSVSDNQFYVDFRYNPDGLDSLNVGLSILGQRESAFYASADLKWGASNKFDFKLMYDDSVLTLYDSSGNIGSLQVNDINMVVDFAKMVLDGSMHLKNENVFTNGEIVVQSATLSVNTKVEAIANGLVRALSGNDYSVDFTLGITDVQLADGYSIADTTIDITLGNRMLNLSGNMLSGMLDFSSKYIDVEINNGYLFGFKAKGYIGDELDVLVTDISFPLPVLNQFMDSPMFAFRDGLVEGDIYICGPKSNPSFYGMAYCQSYEMTLFYLPDQIMAAKNVAVAFNDHIISISRTPMSGYSEADGRYFYGDVAVEMVMQESKVESFDVKLNINKNTPIDFWFPFVSGFEMDIRGDVTGYLNFGISGGRQKLVADIGVSSMLISFRIEDELPSWYYRNTQGERAMPMDMDLSITTGHDIEFYYPEKDNSFINFTLAEDKTVRMIMEDNQIKMDGGFALKTGQVYYFQNDFIIREGSVDLTERKYSTTGSTMPLVLNLVADITDYDSDGNKVVISLILRNATLDNISPRFSSTPMKDENEILAMLGQSVLASSALDQSLSLSSLASLAATATDALTRVGILESNKSYSIAGIVRNSLGLDIFSARSNIISNVLIDALPGDLTGKNDVSMLARYLDGTSIFAGKYITSDWFIKIRLMLKAETNVNNTNDLGHFLAKDLILDTEVSLDWDTPMGTVSLFTNPHELSVFDILDTIGFSVTKQIQF